MYIYIDLRLETPSSKDRPLNPCHIGQSTSSDSAVMISTKSTKAFLTATNHALVMKSS